MEETGVTNVADPSADLGTSRLSLTRSKPRRRRSSSGSSTSAGNTDHPIGPMTAGLRAVSTTAGSPPKSPISAFAYQIALEKGRQEEGRSHGSHRCGRRPSRDPPNLTRSRTRQNATLAGRRQDRDPPRSTSHSRRCGQLRKAPQPCALHARCGSGRSDAWRDLRGIARGWANTARPPAFSALD